MRGQLTVATHDQYLARLPDAKRAALEKLRRTIRSAAPSAAECMSYQLPAFRLDGKVLVLFGATAKHCSFYPGSGTAVEAHKRELEGYSTSKGTIRFDAAKPLPAALVRKIVNYRIAESAATVNRADHMSKPAKSTTRSPTKAGAKDKPGAGPARPTGKTAGRLVDERIRALRGWRAETLAVVGRLIREADLAIIEECKWVKPTNPLGVPVWSHGGIVCTGEAYNQVVKLTFARGAALADPRGLFNSSLDGNTRRAIDIREGDVLHAEAFKALIQAAVAENLRSTAPKSPSRGRS